MKKIGGFIQKPDLVELSNLPVDSNQFTGRVWQRRSRRWGRNRRKNGGGKRRRRGGGERWGVWFLRQLEFGQCKYA